ncbi:uncharacterized protein LTR77_007974 [Saxophila tyrrhenica]|uniref:Uncharacterized protein n=1 Tax=Saxophila tyrrhenica TaxID=1690608 RepID=A0AAV9P561_9PEZI|nr:hypothetical protein LTR77_007974 [Saxophila tyrrhenica]
MFVAVEAFLDTQPAIEINDRLLRRFADFLSDLGTQPVTVTLSSLVADMLDSYANVTDGLEGFSWSRSGQEMDVEQLIREFLFTRECFYYSRTRTPCVEATFYVTNVTRSDLDVSLEFSWNPPIMQFHELRNAVREGAEYILTPTIEEYAATGLAMTVEYFLGPGETWLKWNASSECFKGEVPPKVASRVGAERFETYTMPLELTTRLTRTFTAEMKYEQLIRCALPLTVKRRATLCSTDHEPILSPPFAKTTGLQKLDGLLTRGPLLYSPRTRRTPMPPPPTPWNDPGKENEYLNMKELHLLMERKAQSPRGRSPLRLNSLSLAVLHDAVALSQPPAHMRDLKVRMMHGLQHNGLAFPHDGDTSDKENEGEPQKAHQTQQRSIRRRATRANLNQALKEIGMRSTRVDSRIAPPPQPDAETDSSAFDHSAVEAHSSVRRTLRERATVPNFNESPAQIDLGSTHITRRGRLTSRSGSENDLHSPGMMSPLAHNITPPSKAFLGSPSPKKSRYSAGIMHNPLQQRPLPIRKRARQTAYIGPSIELPKRSEARAPSSHCDSCRKDSSRHNLDGEGEPVCPDCHNIVDDQHITHAAQLSRSDTAQGGGVAVKSDTATKTEKPPVSADEWQAAIQRNYEELKQKKEETLELTMEDMVDSEEELPSFQSDL